MQLTNILIQGDLSQARLALDVSGQLGPWASLYDWCPAENCYTHKQLPSQERNWSSLFGDEVTSIRKILRSVRPHHL